MISVTFVIPLLLLLCLPSTAGKVFCKEGERIYLENLIYDCVAGRKTYYGCKINDAEIKQNTIKEENNLRHQFCYKLHNHIQTDIILGCITDDKIFINETKTVKQSDGSDFTCTKLKKGFKFVKSSPSKNPNCKIGRRKKVSNRFLLECRRENSTHNNFKLIACYPNLGNYTIRVKANNFFDDIVDKVNGFGFRYQCHAYRNSYHYNLVGCLVGKEFVKPDDIFLNERVAILCLQESPNKLRLKPFTHNKFVGRNNCLNIEPKKYGKESLRAAFFSSFDKKQQPKEIRRRCPDSWTFNEKTNFCYKVFNNANWHDAKKKCEAEASTLASVHSLQEAKFIANLAYSKDAETWFWKTQAWIGLHNNDGISTEWKWVDKTPFDYGKWGVNEPDDLGRQHCGFLRVASSSTVMISDVGDFQNTSCDEVLLKFVCKKESL